MGYYSEVALCLTQKAYTRLQAKVAEIEDRVTKYEVENFLPTAEFSETEGDALFYWSNVKWYEDYREIDFLMSFLYEEMDAKEDEEQYLFMRIGETLGDIQTEGAYWGNSFSLETIQELSFATPISNYKTETTIEITAEANPEAPVIGASVI